MTRKTIIPREQAKQDADDAVKYYLNTGGEQVAFGFIDALERAYRQIARHPATGSLRYAHELNLDGLRCWPLKRYPYLVFFVERDHHIDVWRILHAERDIPALMRGPQEQEPPTARPRSRSPRGPGGSPRRRRRA